MLRIHPPPASVSAPIGAARDFTADRGVHIPMTAVLVPRAGWLSRVLAMGAEPPTATARDPAASAAPAPPRRSDDRPDADLLDLEPAEQLAALTRRHAEAVYRVALSVCRDHDLAEDVAQDSLLKAWLAIPSYRGDAPLKNWLLRIVHNTAVSALRRRRDIHVDPHELPEAPGPTRSLEERVEGRLAVDEFEAALSTLDDLSRAVVVLREIEGLSYDEIAEVLEVPLPTVKTRLLRARRKLAAALEGWRP